MIRWRDYPIFTESISTLKDTSMDKHDIGNPAYMTERDDPAVV